MKSKLFKTLTIATLIVALVITSMTTLTLSSTTANASTPLPSETYQERIDAVSSSDIIFSLDTNTLIAKVEALNDTNFSEFTDFNIVIYKGTFDDTPFASAAEHQSYIANNPNNLISVTGTDTFTIDLTSKMKTMEHTTYTIFASGLWEFSMLGTSMFFSFYGNTSDGEFNFVEYENQESTQPTVPLPPDPIKEGHTFVGWYLDEELTIPYDGQPIYEDTILYAKFEINKYTITFDTNGGNAITSVVVDWNTTITLPQTPTLEGHNFAGWYTDATTLLEFDEITPITQDLTLYAKWDAIYYTITFVVDGEIYITIQVPYGATMEEVARLLSEALNKSVVLEDVDSSDLVINDTTIKGWFEDVNKNYISKGYDFLKKAAPITGAIVLVIAIIGVIGKVFKKKRSD